jgi:formate dehydrogenase iron-sulfur subunit
MFSFLWTCSKVKTTLLAIQAEMSRTRTKFDWLTEDGMKDKHGSLFPMRQLSDGKPRSILFDAAICIGCRHCVNACKDWNDNSRDTVFEIAADNWITMEPPVLDGLSPLWARNSCMHCEYPICAAVCPVEAISRFEEGPVVIDQAKCIGCEYCIHACPWGVIAHDNVMRKAVKCTMCSDRIGDSRAPFCVEACPVGALDFGLAADMSSKAARRAEELEGRVYGATEAGGTSVLYVLSAQQQDYGIRAVDPGKYPKHSIPLSLMFKDLFTLRLGVAAKFRALYFAIIHPRRLAYRYWPWRKVG